MSVHIHWIVTTPRIPAGLLTGQAWELLRASEKVYVDPDDPQAMAMRTSGIEVTALPPETAVETLLATGGSWITTASEADPVSLALSQQLADDPALATLEITFGSWDPPGARLLDAVAVIDRLRSPGGCPWDAAQTHASLAPFLMEEAYETVDAISSGDPDHLREELGDLLMQPLFHARFAQDDEAGFSIDDVAGDAVAKLVRRHPHVFNGEDVDTSDGMPDTWDALKRAEKPHRKYAVDGVVTAQPSLSLAAKFLSRTANAGVQVPLEGSANPETPPPKQHTDPVAGEEALGAALLNLVDAARTAGIDPEVALRKAALDYAERARAIESARP